MIRAIDDSDTALKREFPRGNRFPETARHLDLPSHLSTATTTSPNTSPLLTYTEQLELLRHLEPLEDYLARQTLTDSQREGARGYASVLLDAVPGPDGTTRRSFGHVPHHILDEITYGAIDLGENYLGEVDAGYNLDND